MDFEVENFWREDRAGLAIICAGIAFLSSGVTCEHLNF
jgi:hypothetical protein